MNIKCIAFGCLLATAAVSATGGVIRHDRDDAEYLALAQESQFDAVGKLLFTTDVGRFICSGTVIDSYHVATAAHCLDDATTHNVSFTVGGEDYVGTDWTVHENWDPAASLFAGWDIALLRLDRDVSNVGFAKLYESDAEIGQVGTHVGFGATGDGLFGQTLPAGTKRAGNNEIDEFDLVNQDHDRILFNDFDAPAGIDPALMAPNSILDPGYLTNPISAFGLMSGGALDLEYLIGGGDSGGGYFLQEGDQWYLAGIHSFGMSIDANGPNSTYGDFSGSTRVSSFNDWIRTAIVAIPEPGSAILFSTALFGLAGLRRRARTGTGKLTGQAQ